MFYLSLTVAIVGAVIFAVAIVRQNRKHSSAPEPIPAGDTEVVPDDLPDNTRENLSWFGVGVILATAVAIVTAPLVIGIGIHAVNYAVNIHNTKEAARNAVKKHLWWPDEATFSEVTILQSKGDRVVVTGLVQAKNQLGARKTLPFAVYMDRDQNHINVQLRDYSSHPIFRTRRRGAP